MSMTEADRPRPSREMPSGETEVFLTLTVGGQFCCVPVQRVRDVLLPQATTPIPLAPPEIAGSLNLRGRIVTAMKTAGLAERNSRLVVEKPVGRDLKSFREIDDAISQFWNNPSMTPEQGRSLFVQTIGDAR